MTGRTAARAAMLAVLLLASPASHAQRVNLTEMKAAYLLNFMRFAEWPAHRRAAGEVALCILNDRDIAGVLAQLVKGRTLNDVPYSVRELAVGAELRHCHLVYAAGVDAAAAHAIVEAVKGSPALTISDYSQFAQLGGVANFYVQNDALRFAINLDAARRAQVQLSARLLSVGTVVKDDARGGR